MPRTSLAAPSLEAEDVIILNRERVWRVAEPKNGKDFLIPLELTGRDDRLSPRVQRASCIQVEVKREAPVRV